MNFKNVVKIFIVAVFLSGCGSGSGGGTPSNSGGGTSTNISFNLFPSRFFTSYDETVSLSGSDNTGATYTGSTSEKTIGSSTFLGSEAIQLETKIQFTISNGGFADVLQNTYYSTNANNRHLLGFDGDVVATTSATTTAIPETARIGDTGVVGTYVDSRGFETSLSWRLDDAGNGNSNLVLINETNDPFGVLDNTVTTTYLIEQNGDRISIELVTFSAGANLTVTLNGDY